MEKLQILSPPTRPKISGPAFISPTFEGESIEGSLEFSTSLLPYDSNLLESISPEGFFCRTPDYMPDRPSAPMTFFSSPDSSKITAEFNGNDSIFNIFQDVEVDAEFVSSISEQILFELLVNVLRENLKSPKENICINTDFLSIENYINQIFSQCDHAAVLSLLHTPLKKDPLEVLSELQEFGIGSISEAQVWVPDLISVEVYLNIENPEEAMKFADHPLEIQQILTEAQHIHDKMVFDTVNSLMQKHRFPEIPLPWTPSLIVPPHHLTLENIFKNIKAEICKYCSEDFFLIYENGENFQIIRDERQLKLLNTEILESEPDWINYDNEYTQIRLDSADMVFDYLVEEAIGLLA